MSGFPEKVVRLLIQVVIWTAVFSIPYKDGRLFDFSREILFENAIVSTVTDGLSVFTEGVSEIYQKYVVD